MINDMLERCDEDLSQHAPKDLAAIKSGERRALARFITALESGTTHSKLREQVLKQAEALSIPTLGVTGTGGSGKSSLADELVRRFRLDQEDRLGIAILAVDPSRRIDGEDGNAEPVFLVEPEAAHQLVGERGFSRTPGARDPEGRYGKRLGLLQYLLAELGMRGAAL